MPHIIPIKDLKNTGAISQLCKESNEPIYITKNGYGDMVIMSMQMYEENLFMQGVYNKLAESEADVTAGRVKNAKESLKNIREKYNV
ncbi:MAG: type II toxin-antitoxin system Phd/YefM family antitoxin [Oscillospiraceae bacterium]|nr:type II toxin-antitoxin system Phd/YefM family antitoxin [Oscillospiraceae bacterium]